MKKILNIIDKIDKAEDFINSVSITKESIDKYQECIKDHDKLKCATSAVAYGATKQIISDTSNIIEGAGALTMLSGVVENIVTDSSIGTLQIVSGGCAIAGGEYLEMQSDKIGNKVFEYVLDYLESIDKNKTIDGSRSIILKNNDDNKYYVMKIDNTDLMISHHCNKSHIDSIVLHEVANKNNQIINKENGIIKKNIGQVREMLKYDDFRIGNLFEIENKPINMDSFFEKYNSNYFITPQPIPIEKKPLIIQPISNPEPMLNERPIPIIPSGMQVDVRYNKKGFMYTILIPVARFTMGGGGGFCNIL